MSRDITGLKTFQRRLLKVTEAEWLEFLGDSVPSSPADFAERAGMFLRLKMPDSVPAQKVLLRLSLASHRVMGFARTATLGAYPIPPLLNWQELKLFAGLLAEALVREPVVPNQFMARYAEQLSIASIIRCTQTGALFVTKNGEAMGIRLGDEFTHMSSDGVRRFVVLAHSYNERNGLLRGDEILGHANETLQALKLA